MVVKLKNLFLLQQVNLKGISQSKTLPTYQTSLFLGKSMHYFGMLVQTILRKATLVIRKLKDSKCSLEKKKPSSYLTMSILISTDLQLLIYTVMYEI